MQTTNPDPSVTKDIPASGGGVTTLKSFKDLSEQVTLKQIHAFADLLRKGIDNWRTAGSTLVELAKTEPDIFKKIQAIYPNISTSTLETFMRIGRKEIWPPLLADSSFGARRLLECNYDVQKRYTEEPIEVAIEWRGGKIRSKKVRVSELSRSECAIVFDGSGSINNLEQQAFRLPASYRNTVAAPVVTMPKVEPRAPVSLTKDIGYFRIEFKSGLVSIEPCARSSDAQPVRIVDGAATIVLYRKQ